MTKEAIFAGGCFWCIEKDMQIPDVIDVISGYTGGRSDSPNYETAAQEGHREAVLVRYEPQETSYEELVRHFFSFIDPTDKEGQFADRGHTYTTAIYYSSDEERKVVEKVKGEVEEKIGDKVATEILPQEEFYPAEEYHQDYALKNPAHYQAYYQGSGRADYFKERHNK